MLPGRKDLRLVSVAVEGRQLAHGQYHQSPKALTIAPNFLPPAAAQPGAQFQVATRVLLCPRANTHLEVRGQGATTGWLVMLQAAVVCGMLLVHCCSRLVAAGCCGATSGLCAAGVFWVLIVPIDGVRFWLQGLFMSGRLLVTDNEPEGFRWGQTPFPLHRWLAPHCTTVAAAGLCFAAPPC